MDILFNSFDWAIEAAVLVVPGRVLCIDGTFRDKKFQSHICLCTMQGRAEARLFLSSRATPLHQPEEGGGSWPR